MILTKEVRINTKQALRNVKCQKPEQFYKNFGLPKVKQFELFSQKGNFTPFFWGCSSISTIPLIPVFPIHARCRWRTKWSDSFNSPWLSAVTNLKTRCICFATFFNDLVKPVLLKKKKTNAHDSWQVFYNTYLQKHVKFGKRWHKESEKVVLEIYHIEKEHLYKISTFIFLT